MVITIKIKKLYPSEKELDHFYTQLKLIQCPRCKLIGFLILHGFLSGYNEKTTKEIKLSKLESSYNSFKASYYDPHTNATFLALFDNNVSGVIALKRFTNMIKSIYQKNNDDDIVTIILDGRGIGIYNSVTFSTDLLEDLE